MLQEIYQTIATASVNVLGLFLIGWFLKREISRYDQKQTLINTLSEASMSMQSKVDTQEKEIEKLKKLISESKEIGAQQERLDAKLADIDKLTPKVNNIIVEFQLLKKDIELVSKLQKPLFAMRDEVVAIREKMDDYPNKE